MSCLIFQEDGARWRDGGLEPTRHEALAAHLEVCEPCSRVLSDRGLTCRGLTAFLGEYLERTLAPAQRELFEAHVARCEPCVEYLRSYRDTIALARDAHLAGDPPPLPDELVRAIVAARAGRPPAGGAGPSRG